MPRTMVVLCVLVFFVGCDAGPSSGPPPMPRPPMAGPDAPTAGSPVESATTPSGDIVVVNLAENDGPLEYNYRSQTIEVASTIRSIGYVTPELSMVSLKIAPGRSGAVSCVLREPQAWSRLAPGQEVTLRGRTGKVSPYVNFAYQVVKAGPNSAPILKAEDFATEFAKDDEAARSKYSGRSFYLTGKVSSFEKKAESESTVTLQGQPDLPIKLTMDDSFNLISSSLAVGKGVTALCTMQSWSSGTGLELAAVAITVPMPVARVAYPAELPSQAELDAPIAAAMRSTQPDFHATMEQIRMECEQDKAAFDKKYNFKVVDLTGPLRYFAARNGNDFVNLDETTRGREFAFSLAEAFPFYQVVPGQEITLRVRFGDLIDGVILSTGTRQPATRQLSADELVKSCLEAGDSFETDWKESTVEVTGKVRSSSVEKYSAVINLDGPDDYVVEVSLYSGEYGRRAKVEELDVGQEIRLSGKISRIEPDTKQLHLHMGWIDKESK